MPTPDLSDLHAFLAVAHSRGFRQAAYLRSVSASSLSDAIRRLETQLGVRLLNRTTRSVTPTEAGQRLIDRLTPAFTEIASALDAVNTFRDSPTGTLKLNVPGIASREILPSIVPRFLKAHPGIQLELTTTDRFIDVLAAGFDAGIRYDERIERDMIALPIGPRTQRFVAAAAPAYLQAHGEPKHPRELVDHACIAHRFESGVLASWEFTRAGKIVRIAPRGPLVSSSIEVSRSVALAGLGITYTFEEFLRDEIAQGTLVPVLKAWWQSFPGPSLYYPSRAHMPGPLRAFVDFIRAENSKS